ncbi:MAG: hypothetical protein RJA07_2849 [Bacteroidota bacterium]|jgi:hypothetical protein
MNLKNKNIYIIIGLMLFSQFVFAQSGFIGKKHEVGIDLYNAVFTGKYMASYKYSYSKRASLIVDAGLIHHSEKGTSATTNATNTLDGYIPDASFSGKLLGIGILWNSKSAGMNMPIGYYTGFSIDYVSGTLNNTIAAQKMYDDVKFTFYNSYGYSQQSSIQMPNNSELSYGFKTTGYNFNFYYGKNIYLAKNLVLDLCIKWGFAYYRFTPSNFTPYPSYDYNYNGTTQFEVGTPYQGGYTFYKDGIYYIKSNNFNLQPDVVPRSILNAGNVNGSTLINSSTNIYGIQTDKLKTYNKFRLLLIPQIKIGYLF